jgi:predicted lipoprotein
MGKLIKYGTIVLIAGFLLYNSVYIKKLSAVRATTPTAFDAAAFSKKLFAEQLPARIQSAVPLDTLLRALEANPNEAFDKYTNALAIGNICYSLVQATGRVVAIKDDEVIIQVGAAPVTIHLATEYIYGNAIRDASGLVNVKDFVNTTDLNNISESLNKQVKELILPPFKNSVQKTDSVWFAGALELNKEHVHVQEPEVIPVQVKIIR